MRLTRRSLLAATPALAVALTACDSKKDTDSAPASATATEANGETANIEDAKGEAADAQPVGPGTYTAKHERGTVYTLTFPAELPDDAKGYFSKVFTKGQTLSAVKVETDNTAATKEAGMAQVTLVDAEGTEVRLNWLLDVIGETLPVMNDDFVYSTFDGDDLSEEEYMALDAEANDLLEKYSQTGARPHAKGTEYFVTYEPLPEKIVWAGGDDGIVQVPFDLGNE